MAKSWMAQDYYNEYLDLKVEISERTKNLKYVKSIGTVTEKGIQLKEDKLNEKIDRFKFVLEELKLSGVNFQDLLLLSVGVEIDLFN